MEATAQLSVAVAFHPVPEFVYVPAEQTIVDAIGQVIVGGLLSWIVTVAVHEDTLPLASVTVRITGVILPELIACKPNPVMSF